MARKRALTRQDRRRIELEKSRKGQSVEPTPGRLKTWDEIPSWQQDNEYILSGYREVTGSFIRSFHSLAHLHNETINIYSHLPKVQKLGNQLDYLGIVILMWGSTVPSIYYGFYCNPALQKVYWLNVSVLASLCTIATLHPKFRHPTLRPYRAAMYAGLGLSAVVFVVHGILLHGWTIQNHRMSLDWMALMASLNLLGATVYAARIPEKLKPYHYTLANYAPARASERETGGNYIINNCQSIARSPQLHKFLPGFQQALQLVLSDLEFGTASQHGFSTFFKSNTNRPIVRHVFRAIANGTDLPTGKLVIECASPELGYTEEQLQTFSYLCSPRPPSFKRIQATALVGLGTVVLCPAFWAFANFPEIDDCVAVAGRRGRKKFLGAGGTLSDTKFSVLLHEMLHLYNPLEGAEGAGVGEVYDIQGCADLDKDKSVANAENWAYYANCELFPLLPPFCSFPLHYL
ncbi:MAG: hypothetical protein Q9216_002628 [Gyalolechia sp. 2 TL-2023]